MSLRKFILTVIALGTLLIATHVSAGDAPALEAVKTNKTAYNAQLRGGEIVGMHQVQRAFLTLGTNQIAFIVPSGFRMDASDLQKIVLTEPARGYFLAVRISAAPSVEPGQETSYFKTAALARFPGAIIADQSTQLVANHSGPSFDLTWVNGAGTAQKVRIAFIPSSAGVLELSVLAPADKFKDALLYFSLLLGSVQNNEQGKIVIVPRPDFS